MSNQKDDKDYRAVNASDITERLVGITPVYLQNFVQRGSYGIRASVKSGQVRVQRRSFSADDVFGIALVWLLFESGLRSDPISRILNDIAGTKKANANLAAKTLLESRTEYLRIVREPRKPAKTPLHEPIQKVETMKHLEISDPRQSHPNATEVLVPVGSKFTDIQRRMEILF
jgi:hypothetical protein